MVRQWAPRSLVTQFGPNHWKVATGGDCAVRVEPRRLYGVAWGALGISVAIIVVAWLSPAVTAEAKIVLSALGTVAGVTITTVLLLFDRYEQQLGPYVSVDRDGVHLRHGLVVPFEEIAAFEVIRRWGPAGDGETWVGYLVLRTQGGEVIEILASVCPSEIYELKRILDQNISRLLAAKSTTDSSAK